MSPILKSIILHFFQTLVAKSLFPSLFYPFELLDFQRFTGDIEFQVPFSSCQRQTW